MRAQRVARRFLAAFLRYEVGHETSATRRDIRATTAPALARSLLAAPPRTPPKKPVPARLIAVELNGSDGSLTELNAVLARPGGAPTVVVVTVTHAPGGPVVSGLR